MPPARTVFAFGRFRLDTCQGVLLHAGEVVPLPPKTLETLVALVERRGEVVSKSELLERVWPDQFVAEANLTQHVFTLRRTLAEHDERTTYIETIPKRGYRFVAAVAAVDAAPSGALAPVFEQITFRRGVVHAARFGGGAATIFYGASWEGARSEIDAIDRDEKRTRSLGLGGASLLAVSSRGEIAVALDNAYVRGYVGAGPLAVVACDGGEPRRLLDGVQAADWSPDGASLAIVREVDGQSRLEYPPGNVLFRTSGWIASPRVSPTGERVAFVHHPVLADDSGAIFVVDRALDLRTLSSGWISAQGLAWSPAGDEVWFTASRTGSGRELFAASLDGAERFVLRIAGSLVLHDVASTGDMLLVRDDTRVGIMAHAPGAAAGERDLSWHDWSLARDLSDDGRLLLFTEAGASGGAAYGVYLRETYGGEATRLGDGSALALSPDLRWALAKTPAPDSRLVLFPTAGGAPRALDGASVLYQQWASWLPDGRRILFAANPPGSGTRIYLQAVDGGPPVATAAPEGSAIASPHVVSPDGGELCYLGPDSHAYRLGLDGAEPRRIEGLERGDAPLRWSGDGDAIFFRRRGDVPASVLRLDLATSRVEAWRELVPADPVGVHEILRILLTPDGAAYAYTFVRALSTLFLAGAAR